VLPLEDAEPECARRTEREAEVLRALARLDLPLRLPELIAVGEDGGRPALVETMVEGALPVHEPLVTPVDPKEDLLGEVFGFLDAATVVFEEVGDRSAEAPEEPLEPPLRRAAALDLAHQDADVVRRRGRWPATDQSSPRIGWSRLGKGW